MSGSKAGFTLLELVVVVAILGIMATIVIPRLSWRDPVKQRDEFVNQLNSLLHHAAADAFVTSMMHKVIIDVANRRIDVQQQTTKKDAQGDWLFVTPKRPYAHKGLRIPANYEIKNLIIEGFDEMTRFAGGSTKTSWFYIMPQGLAQSVIINILDRTQGKRASQHQQIGLVLNPLSVQFQVHHAFQQ